MCASCGRTQGFAHLGSLTSGIPCHAAHVLRGEVSCECHMCVLRTVAGVPFTITPHPSTVVYDIPDAALPKFLHVHAWNIL